MRLVIADLTVTFVGNARDISTTNRMQLDDDHGVRAQRAHSTVCRPGKHVTETALAASTKTARTSPPEQIHPRGT